MFVNTTVNPGVAPWLKERCHRDLVVSVPAAVKNIVAKIFQVVFVLAFFTTHNTVVWSPLAKFGMLVPARARYLPEDG